LLEIAGLLLALILSLIIVIKSSDLFVDNIVEIGAALGISQIILGVTASAIGTSLPEFGSAMIASLSGSTEIGVGTVIGSNIWNIAGILGISATVAGVIGTNPKGITRDGMVTLGTGLILIFFMLWGEITRIASIVMILFYLFYLWLLIKAQKEYQDSKSPDKGFKKKPITKKRIGFSILGIAGLIVGCRILVFAGVELARIAGIPEMIMGLFTLAIGTSIPELVVTLSSAMKGLHELSIGTVLGSNTFNILIGIGVPALFMNIPVDPLSLSFDAPVMILVIVLVLLLIKKGGMKLNRVGGIILISTYVVYAVSRIYLLA